MPASKNHGVRERNTRDHQKPFWSWTGQAERLFLKLLGRRPEPATLTFNQRAQAFWKWFAASAPRFGEVLASGQGVALTDEVSAMVRPWFPGFAWIFGPGPQNQGHSFTLSGEGAEHRQLLAQQWLALAPKLPGWTFYASRQPGPIEGHVIIIDERKFDPREMWVTPVLDVEREKFDLTIWHPAWPELEERRRWEVTFLFLDEALGEYGTQWWVGLIRFGDDRLAKAIPIGDLPEFVKETSDRCGWKKYPPGEAWEVFTIEPAEGRFPRSDIFVLTTAVPQLQQSYLAAEGNLDNPLRGSGADYVYISLPRELFPAGREAARRGEIEQALDAALQAEQSGRCLGGGLGQELGYADLLIFDGSKSLELIRKTLKSLHIVEGVMIEYFAPRGGRTSR